MKSIGIHSRHFILFQKVEKSIFEFKEFIGSGIDTIKLWRSRSKQRQALSRLPEYRLIDLGVSEADRRDEVKKPFWKV